MSAPELLHRVKTSLYIRQEAKNYTKLSVPQTDLSKKASWIWDISRRAAFQEALSSHKTEHAAQKILAHRFSFFALGEKDFGQDIDWHKDYKNGKKAPAIFYRDIDYRDSEKIGDIKYIWEHNRHGQLVVLARAYYLTGKQEYKDEIAAQLVGWIKDNPYLIGVNWESTLELGIRLIAWSWVKALCGPFKPEVEAQWHDVIYRHCHRIAHHFSAYSSANNHLVGEAAGLFVGAVNWPLWLQSRQWQERSFHILVEEMEKQNATDGGNKEQAFSYQNFVLDFFLQAALAGKANGVRFPEAYWQRMEQMMNFLGCMMNKAGRLPNIGDADDAHVVPLADAEGFNYESSLLATGAVLFNRGDFKARAGHFDEKSFWLLGPEGRAAFDRLPAKPFVAQKKFPESGYYILSDQEGTDDETKIVFDCGPLGFLSIAAHGHADALSFTLSLGGVDFFIDPGTFAYHTQKQWRSYFKGTGAHNSVRIDGTDQSESGGNFMWLRKAKSVLKTYETTPDHDKACGSHDGYRRLGDPVIHEREIVFHKKEHVIEIIDRLQAQNEHTLEQFFHFDKSCRVKSLPSGGFEVLNQGKAIRLALDRTLTSGIFQGSLEPLSGWQSVRFDIKEACPTIVGKKAFKGNCTLETEIKILL